MKKQINSSVLLFFILFVITACKKSDTTNTSSSTVNTITYTGTGSVNQGVGTTTISNLFPTGQRCCSL